MPAACCFGEAFFGEDCLPLVVAPVSPDSCGWAAVPAAKPAAEGGGG